MRYEEHAPHSSLQDFVKCFWTLEKEYTSEEPSEEVTPDACIELILNFGAPYFLQSKGVPEREMPAAFLVGLQKKPLLYHCIGTVKIVATRFYAWGVGPFFTPPYQSINNMTVTLNNEWRGLADKIEPKIRRDDFVSAITDVEDFLIGKLLTASFDLKQIQIAAQLLYREKGQFRISELAEYCNLSERQLQRQFQSAVGVSPKTLARTIRFEEIRNRLMFNPDASLTDMAYEFGYTDQAHFIRDFKEFTGKTPGEFAVEMKPWQRVFHENENVVFLQFASRNSV